MNIDTLINTAGIPALMGCICLYYAYRLLAKNDYKGVVVRGTKPRHPEEFCREGGKLLIGFGVASFLMGALMLVNPIIGLIEIVIAVVAIVILWKKMAEKHG